MCRAPLSGARHTSVQSNQGRSRVPLSHYRTLPCSLVRLLLMTKPVVPADALSRAVLRRAPRVDGTLLMAGTCSLLAFVLPLPQHNTIAGLPAICPFHNLTGLPCPGCGLTRSVVCCTHGLWHQALLYHPLGPLALGVMLGITVWRVTALCAPLRLKPLNAYLARRLQVGFATGLFVLLLATWGVRLAGFWPLPP